MAKPPAIIIPRRKEVTTRVTKTTEVSIKARASFLLTKARSLARAWLLTSVLFYSRSCLHCLSLGIFRHWGHSILLDWYQAWKMLYNRHRDREGVIRRTNCEPGHRGYRARAFSARHVEHRDYSSRTVRLSFLSVCRSQKSKSKWFFKGNYLVIGRMDRWLLPWCQSRDSEGQQLACVHFDILGTYHISIAAGRSLMWSHVDHWCPCRFALCHHNNNGCGRCLSRP
jgi:hypothetical protein